MQYPHVISFKVVTESSTDADGNWTEGTETLKSYPARCEPVGFGSGGSAKAVDGSRVQLDWVVYLPLPVENIPVGTSVIIEMDGVQMTDTVKRFIKSTFNARAWL